MSGRSARVRNGVVLRRSAWPLCCSLHLPSLILTYHVAYRQGLTTIRKTEDELRAKREELRALEEGVLKKQKEVEKQAAKAKTTVQNNTHGSAREAELQSEVDKCMVRRSNV